MKAAAQAKVFPRAIGVVDGTLIELADKPRGENAVSYRTKKKTLGLVWRLLVSFGWLLVSDMLIRSKVSPVSLRSRSWV